ncbi:MAG TPA: DUF4166 domain-containing protein [Allosphingosinicella sp.]|nr:DUF4166 domain-containing protein [Allosphingosinicella sp.]
MAEQGKADFQLIQFPAARRTAPPGDIGDLRFRTLIGEQAWARLPEAVRTGFGKRIAAASIALYAGEIVECRMSRMGWLLAQAARLIGGPLPTRRDLFVSAIVAVTEEPASGGQLWTRIYGRARGFPQVISSCKSFSGPTGLEERIGGGFGIALNVEVEGEALHFVSDHYFAAWRGLRLTIPRWLSPGRLRVSHVDCGHGLFAFVLALDHHWWGEMIRQTAMFSEREEGP